MAHYDRLKDAENKPIVKQDGQYFAVKVTLRSDTGRVTRLIHQPVSRLRRSDGSANIAWGLQVLEPNTVPMGEDGQAFPGYEVKAVMAVPSTNEKRTHHQGWTVLPLQPTNVEGKPEILRLTDAEMLTLGEAYTVNIGLAYADRAYPLKAKRDGTREKAGESRDVFEYALPSREAFGCYLDMRGTVTDALFKVKTGRAGRKLDTFGGDAGESLEEEYENVLGAEVKEITE